MSVIFVYLSLSLSLSLCLSFFLSPRFIGHLPLCTFICMCVKTACHWKTLMKWVGGSHSTAVGDVLYLLLCQLLVDKEPRCWLAMTWKEATWTIGQFLSPCNYQHISEFWPELALTCLQCTLSGPRTVCVSVWMYACVHVITFRVSSLWSYQRSCVCLHRLVANFQLIPEVVSAYTVITLRYIGALLCSIYMVRWL